MLNFIQTIIQKRKQSKTESFYESSPVVERNGEGGNHSLKAKMRKFSMSMANLGETIHHDRPVQQQPITKPRPHSMQISRPSITPLSRASPSSTIQEEDQDLSSSPYTRSYSSSSFSSSSASSSQGLRTPISPTVEDLPSIKTPSHPITNSIPSTSRHNRVYSNPFPLQSTPNLLSRQSNHKKSNSESFATFPSSPFPAFGSRIDVNGPPPMPPRRSSLRASKAILDGLKLDAVKEMEKRKEEKGRSDHVEIDRMSLGRPIKTESLESEDDIADMALLPWMVPVRERRFGAFPTRPARRVY